MARKRFDQLKVGHVVIYEGRDVRVDEITTLESGSLEIRMGDITIRRTPGAKIELAKT